MADQSGGSLYFYGQALQGADAVHTPYNVYWLTQAAGATMKVVLGKPPTPTGASSSFVSTVHAEQNLLPYPSLLSNPDADFWYWDTAYALNPGMGPMIPFSVPSPGATGSGTATIRVSLQGASDLVPGHDHHTHIYVNGTEINVGGGTWDGLEAVTLTGSFNAKLLKTDGTANVVHVAEELDTGVPYSVVEVNGFELDYARSFRANGDELRLRSGGKAAIAVSGFSGPNAVVLDITDPRNPQWLTSTKVAASGTGSTVTFAPAATTEYFAAIPRAPAAVLGNAPSSLKSASNAANYLVLTPSSLSAGASALASTGAAASYSCRTSTTSSTAASPTHARFATSSPYTAADWSGKPRFVALLGKGNDRSEELPRPRYQPFPVLMTPTPDGLYAADNRYATSTTTACPTWHRPHLGADERRRDQLPREGADIRESGAAAREQRADRGRQSGRGGELHRRQPGGGAGAAGKGLPVHTVYLEMTTLADARTAIVSALDSTAGMGLFNYVGHGGTNQLADENLLSNDQGDPDLQCAQQCVAPTDPGGVHLLRGRRRVPRVRFVERIADLAQGGGVVAAFAPTGLSDNSKAHILNLSLVSTLGGTSARPTLGEAAAAAIADFARKGGPRYMREMYSVIGDPGLRIQQ
jgi:hypothetical protein